MSTALSFDALKSQASSLDFRNKAFINGAYVDALSGKTFECISPRDGSVLTKIAECDSADVDRAVAAARAVFEKGSWSEASPGTRKAVMMKFADLMEKHAAELALLESLDMGKPITLAVRDDIPLSYKCIRWYAEAIDKIYDEISPSDPHSIGMITREPLGVVAAVVPWNFPLMMAVWKLGPALAMGNSIILKPAEQSSLTALRVAELAVEAGIPEGVLNVVPGFGPTAGKALGLHEDVDCITFTGSGEVGKLFLQYSGQSNMKRVWLECGGKSPNIVLADCPDLDAAAEAAAGGIFYNQGEVCTAGSRLIVEESIKDEFIEKVIAAGKAMQPGDPLDPNSEMGAIVDETQMNRVLGYIEKGQSEGAAVSLGGNRVRTESGGYYIEPTVFDGVTNAMTIAREEIFGPVLSVISVADWQEAVKTANDTPYGLAAAVWTRDINKAHLAARKLRAGLVWVNCWDGGSITMPFGGYKQSGTGRDRSLHALDKYCEIKSTWIALGDA
ncbi:aldehyde dehydrogenase [Thalassospira sp. TSL5-1]|uniref:aldehyde dehydrogenase n=1 Tax=Thalassospira sp. TSL5-1 TaxID=1544451 RepID=UPI00093D685A|nr:aldehyde dehydrogenase [Thalassospira sp. TSL5-1]OKH90131.1 aldehyde dehydrogenase [Thalassospira sp. TSL5-1]